VFVDEAKIFVKAGDGRQRLHCLPPREIRAARRPSGGRRGHGGNIYLESQSNDNTLLRYRYNREFKADRGRHGEGSNCTGHSGQDHDPASSVGTLVFDEQGATIADLASPANAS